MMEVQRMANYALLPRAVHPAIPSKPVSDECTSKFLSEKCGKALELSNGAWFINPTPKASIERLEHQAKPSWQRSRTDEGMQLDGSLEQPQRKDELFALVMYKARRCPQTDPESLSFCERRLGSQRGHQ
jgi:hypothetical protein